MVYATATDQHTCLGDTRCKAYDHLARPPHPAFTDQPLCPACLDAAERDIRALTYDYLDLAQLHEASMSQAITEKTAGSKEKTMLLVGYVEALQAEIVHVTTTWEYEVRVAARLTTGRRLPIPSWATTRHHPLPAVKTRGGAAVQRAVGVLTTHLYRLVALPSTLIRPTGIEDDFEDITGWQAVRQLADLHGRCRGVLGRTTRTFWIPGECWSCDARPKPGEDGPLLRSEPRYEGDPMQVHCKPCGATRPYADYEHFQGHLQWPDVATDNLVRVAA